MMMARVGLRLGPFFVSTGARPRQRRGPSAAQLNAQAAAAAQRRTHIDGQRAQRRATFGSYRVADARTWFFWQWLLALAALSAVAVLPLAVGDGPTAEKIWLVAVASGVLMWAIRLAQVHAAQAPSRRAATEHAARAEQTALADAARRAAYLAPRQIGNTWRHGQCAVNHRTRDVALRCNRG
jgi:hypothetical protein